MFLLSYFQFSIFFSQLFLSSQWHEVMSTDENVSLYLIFLSDLEKYSFTFLEGLFFYFVQNLLLKKYCWFNWCFSRMYWTLHALSDSWEEICCNRYFLFAYCFWPLVNFSQFFRDRPLASVLYTCHLDMFQNLHFLSYYWITRGSYFPFTHIYNVFWSILFYYTFLLIWFSGFVGCFLSCYFIVVSKKTAETEKL